MINVWLCQVKSDSNLLIAEFETYFVFMQNLGLIPKSTSCYCKNSKPLVTYSRQKRAHRNCVFILCSIQVCSGTAEHNCPKDNLPKSLTHIWQHCLQTPIRGRDWKQNLRQYQLSHLVPFGAGSCFQTPHSFQVSRQQKNLHPLLHSQMSRGKHMTSRENLHTFSLVMSISSS